MVHYKISNFWDLDFRRRGWPAVAKMFVYLRQHTGVVLENMPRQRFKVPRIRYSKMCGLVWAQIQIHFIVVF